MSYARPINYDPTRWHERRAITVVKETGRLASLGELKNELRIRHNNLDTVIEARYRAALTWAERSCNRTLVPVRSYRMVDRAFPQDVREINGYLAWLNPRVVDLHYPPVISVDAVKYVDGTTRTGTFVGDTGVNTTTDVITLSAVASWLLTGVVVTYDDGGNGVVAGLTDSGEYYVATSDSTSFTLHTSAYDARLGQNKVNLTATSTGNHTVSSVEQLVAATNYVVVKSQDAVGYLEWCSTYSFPDLEDRADAVRYEWTAGYGERSLIPPDAVTAVLFKTRELVDREPEAGETAKNLIMNVWGGKYA